MLQGGGGCETRAEASRAKLRGGHVQEVVGRAGAAAAAAAASHLLMASAKECEGTQRPRVTVVTQKTERERREGKREEMDRG